MKIKDGFVLQQVGDSFLAVATGDLAKEAHTFVRMNQTGAFLWNQIFEKSAEEEDIVKALIAAYDVPEDIARRDIGVFLETLRNHGILE